MSKDVIFEIYIGNQLFQESNISDRKMNLNSPKRNQLKQKEKIND